MIRVFVVDDSAFVRKALRRVFSSTPDLRVVGEAASGAEALARIPESQADVVTLDVEMQGLNGLAVLRQLLTGHPGLRVIMLSAHTHEGAAATMEALSVGAADFVDKQSLNLMDLDALGRELVDRVRHLAGRQPPSSVPSGMVVPEVPELQGAELCVIGASTGGPAALQTILEALPADFPMPIAIVQHMPPGFTGPFAARLNALCRLTVREAADGMRLAPGQAIIAPAGRQLRLSSGLVTMVELDRNGARHAPSVDVLFESAARVRAGRVVGVLLTGMGEDGADGLRLIRASGGTTLAESQATCVVYGMPRAAVERGAVQHLLPLPAIAEVLARTRPAPARRLG